MRRSDRDGASAPNAAGRRRFRSGAGPAPEGGAADETGAALYLVSTPIGHLGDLTHRAVDVLRAADVLFAEDTRHTRVLLRHYGIERRCVSYHEHNEAARTAEARRSWGKGRSIALVADAGTPLISDPGLRLVRAAVEAGVRVIPVPGASAVLAALVASGLDPEPFTYFGFLPRARAARSARWAALRSLGHTAVLFESPQRLARTLGELAEALGGERAVVVARELTKMHEEFFRGTLAEAAAYYRAREVRGEVVVCVGGAISPERGEREAAGRAAELARAGATTPEITRALRQEFGLDRNRAYELALEAQRRAGAP